MSWRFVFEDPSMEEMEECAHRACFRMALVTVMHSVTTRATGSIATLVLLAAWPFDLEVAILTEDRLDHESVISKYSLKSRGAESSLQGCCGFDLDTDTVPEPRIYVGATKGSLCKPGNVLNERCCT